MSSLNSSPMVGLAPKITKSEQRILNIIKEGTIDTKQILIIYNEGKTKKVGLRNIQKAIKNLKQKGTLSISSPIANQNEQANEQNGIRINGEQFTIIPITKSIKYNQLIGKKINIDNNTILIHNDIIQYYCEHSSFGSDSWAATAKAFLYHDRVVRTLENDLGCVLIKPRSQNITRVKAEYAHINNGLAKKLDKEGEKFRCRGSEDGKVWFIIDNSWNLHEAETTGKHAQRDMQNVIEPFFNDMRDKESYLPSDTKSMLDKLTIISGNIIQSQQNQDSLFYKTNESVNWLAENIKTHGPAWFGMSKEAKIISKHSKTLTEYIKQKKLGEYL